MLKVRKRWLVICYTNKMKYVADGWQLYKNNNDILHLHWEEAETCSITYS